ncbi:MAG TPA: low affinity iron permease family protein [Saprospiraceae bacterium]|nr:low affinity iron permease family protein [Saprospiraceae bacterium]
MKSKKQSWFEIFATKATHAAGSNYAFIIACLIIVVWLITGPIFNYSDTWQLVINTGTTIITFLMVFLIQKTQNKDAIAIQIKLNELVAASDHASNRIVSVEDLSEEELIRLNTYYTKLAELMRKEKDPKASRSIEDTNILKDEKEKLHNKIREITK